MSISVNYKQTIAYWRHWSEYLLRHQQLLKQLALTLLVVNAGVSAYAWHNIWPIGFDARAYIEAAHQINLGNSPYPDQIRIWSSPDDTPPYLYPPTLGLLLLPFLWLPAGWVMPTWLLLVTLQTAALGLLLVPWIGRYRAALGLLLFVPMMKSIALGQINSTLALLTALTLHVAVRSNQNHRSLNQTGAWLAIGTMLKLTPALAIMVLVMQRRWRAVGWALGTTVLVLALGCFWVSPIDWWTGVSQAASVEWYSPAFLSWRGQLDWYFGLSTRPISMILSIALAGITLWRAWYISLADALSAALLLPTLVAPIAWDHHTVMVLPVLALLWHRFPRYHTLVMVTWGVLAIDAEAPFAWAILGTACWFLCCWPQQNALMDTPHDSMEAVRCTPPLGTAVPLADSAMSLLD